MRCQASWWPVERIHLGSSFFTSYVTYGAKILVRFCKLRVLNHFVMASEVIERQFPEYLESTWKGCKMIILDSCHNSVYFYLELTRKTIRYGPTKVKVKVNGKTCGYVVNERCALCHAVSGRLLVHYSTIFDKYNHFHKQVQETKIKLALTKCLSDVVVIDLLTIVTEYCYVQPLFVFKPHVIDMI
jgi:hypothetical protein